MEKFLSHGFHDILFLERGSGKDAFLKILIEKKRSALDEVLKDPENEWITVNYDVVALRYAMDEIHRYYSFGKVSREQWVIAGSYCENVFKEFDRDLADLDH